MKRSTKNARRRAITTTYSTGVLEVDCGENMLLAGSTPTTLQVYKDNKPLSLKF